MDCTTFQECEIDALYGELDAAASAAMAEHAATCPACAARFARLQGTRGLVLSVVEPVPTDFESRIMAAVDAGMARRSAAPALAAAAPMMMPAQAQVIPLRPAPGAGEPHAQRGNVVPLWSRPMFMAAAGLLVFIGAGAFVLSRSMSDSAPKAMSASSPAATAAAADQSPGSPTPPAFAVGSPPPAAAAEAPAASGAVALADPPPPTAAAFAASPAPAPATVAPSKPVGGASGGGASASDTRALAAAKQLYAQGRYSDALPRFEALKSTFPEADLYAARCIAKTRGCGAAAPRYDQVAQANSGTEAGNRATLEGARCYQATGELAEARKRYVVAKDEDGVSTEAQKALDSLDGNTGPGSAGPGVHAAPKAARPSPRSPPAAVDNVMK